VPGYWSTYARAINNDGDVVGYAEKRDGTVSSFLRRDGAVTLFTPSALDADNSWAMGINNLGDIVGQFTVGWDWHGYLLHDGVYTQIDMPGELAALPYGINDRGDIVGTTYLGLNWPDHGFLLRDGAFTEIKVPGSEWTQALSVNNSGDIVGNFGDASGIHGFLLSGGAYSTIDYPDAVQTQVTGINDDGEFVGRVREAADGPLVAFARVKGEFLPLRGPCDIRVSGATGINEKREIAGFFVDQEEGIRWAFVASHVKKGD
jgi:probable HAF family extracellular repeat protein